MAQRHEEKRRQSAGQHRRQWRLQLGACVWVQGQTTKAWSKSGTVVEVHPYRQYAVKMDGSGRISLRTRGHLKEATPPWEPPSIGGVPEVQSPTPEAVPPLASPGRERPQRQRSRPTWLDDYMT
ncbi:hypothetical protein E2C01_074605 [Portunus trituberculatus]|uniref:Uncharacterized protein n=1 Tax=Portunus trituberculatus TaxID=210409 RepID=A0A5B7I3Q3_PORTR|nr:hypothetical protein [Portunus trituberculatus]